MNKKDRRQWYRAHAVMKAMGCRNYSEYLESRHWIKFRDDFKSNPKNQVCVICGSSPVEVHHRDYQNIGRETANDCISFCQRCHQSLHDYQKFKNPANLGLREITARFIVKRKTGRW